MQGDNDREDPLVSELEADELLTTYGNRAVEENTRSPLRLVLGVMLLVLVVGVAYYFTLGGSEPEPAPEAPAVITPAPPPAVAKPETPDIPTPAPPPVTEAEPEMAEVVPAQPPLTLADSDEPVREALAQAGSSDLYTSLLSNTDLIQRSTGVIDGMSRGLIMNKILPLPRPSGKFTTLEMGGQVVLDPASYQRYDPYAGAVAELDASQLVSVFHEFRPLLEQAYAQLGYPPADFDNILIRALDEVIATPEIRDTIPLKKKEAVYLFVDPALEQLAPLQKQLIRMGPDNIATIKTQAKALRAQLLGQ